MFSIRIPEFNGIRDGKTDLNNTHLISAQTINVLFEYEYEDLLVTTGYVIIQAK